ncbi:MAG: RtcB family protein [Thermoleophilia bacterium]
MDELVRIDHYAWLIPPEGEMRVPGMVFADEALLKQAQGDDSLRQVRNVATLPGIVGASLAMPDIHQGYGFPIGGVAAVDAASGVVSPGGVGFDINCGVRLVRTAASAAELEPRVPELLYDLQRRVPTGNNDAGVLSLTPRELAQLVEHGAPWLLERGLATERDVERIEDAGVLPGASADAVSQKAMSRGRSQIGSLGAGNHFLEVQAVERVEDAAAAEAFGVFEGQAVIMIHTGSRGFGHQVCTDHLQRLEAVARQEGYSLPDRELAWAPLATEEAREYLAAMAAAANFAFCNRQVITAEVRAALERLLGRPWERLGVELVYDVAHNIAKWEEHAVEGEARRLLVHRKGATRAFGPGHAELPEAYRGSGQPVIIPGDMGTESWLCVGTKEAERRAFGSACHGAGRRLSRAAARRQIDGVAVRRELEARGISVLSSSPGLLAEESPQAYKEVSAVVGVVAGAGLVRKVARLRPLGVLKG